MMSCWYSVPDVSEDRHELKLAIECNFADPLDVEDVAEQAAQNMWEVDGELDDWRWPVAFALHATNDGPEVARAYVTARFRPSFTATTKKPGST